MDTVRLGPVRDDITDRGGCRVYWGSHGCRFQRGHAGPCECGCCDCGEHHPYPEWPDEDVLCVCKAPYYGADTRFYGEDVWNRGLRAHRDDYN